MGSHKLPIRMPKLPLNGTKIKFYMLFILFLCIFVFALLWFANIKWHYSDSLSLSISLSLCSMATFNWVPDTTSYLHVSDSFAKSPHSSYQPWKKEDVRMFFAFGHIFLYLSLFITIFRGFFDRFIIFVQLLNEQSVNIIVNMCKEQLSWMMRREAGQSCQLLYLAIFNSEIAF